MKREDELFLAFRRTRDAALLGKVYDLAAPGLLHVATHLVASPAEAEDLLQATFLAAIERAHAFDPEKGTLAAWLFGILTNQARSARAEARRSPDPERLAVPEGELTPLERAAADELAESLGRALSDLPRSYRPVVTLRLLHGLSPTEIARALERPPGTVRSQLQRGLERLREALPAGHLGGLAGVAAVLLGRPARGMEALRADVVAQAASALPVAAGAAGATSSLLATLTGALLMKKTLAFAAVIVAAVGWVALDRERPQAPAPEVARAAVAELAQPQAPRETEAVAVPPEETRARVEPAQLVPESPPAERALAEAPRSAATGDLVVRVRTPSEEPAESVLVVIDLLGDVDRERRTGTTDSRGELAFDGLPVGPVHVRVLRGREDTAMVRPDRTTEIRLGLFEGLTIEGEVVDELDRPVPEAEIWLSERWRPNSGFVVARADRAGRFRLGNVTRDQFVGARAAGRASSFLHPVHGSIGDTQAVRIVLGEPGGRVLGRVVDAAGAPIAGARVLVGNEYNNSPESTVTIVGDHSVPSAPPERLTSDASGAFQADSVPSGSVTVKARRSGFATTELVVPLAPRGEAEVELVLQAGATVRGRATDADGQPVGRALVITEERGRRFATASTYTALDGTFLLTDVVPGERTLLCVLEGRMIEVEETLELESGRVTEWNPVLAGGPRIHGTLVDAAGAPIPEWTVVAHLPDTPADERMRSQRTDPRGSFSIEVEDPEAAHTLWAQGPGGWRLFPVRILHDVVASEEPLTITVGDDPQATGTILCAVVDEGGAPAAGAFLCVWQVEEKIWREFPIDQETGRVEIERVPPGRLGLEVQSKAHPNQHLGEHTIAAGETLDLGRVTLQASGFLVVELGGEEVQPGELELVLVGSDFKIAGTLEHSGRTLRSSPLAPGPYRLRLSGPFVQQQRLEFDVTAGQETRLDVVLERTGLRRIVFEGVDGGAPPASMWLQVLDGDREVWVDHAVMQTPAGELFADVSLLPGVYRFRGGTPDGLVVQGTLDVVGFEGTQAALVARFGG